MIKLIVDGKQIEAAEGTTVLQACLDNEIYIPNLCYLKEMTNPPTACRLCFVEVEGQKKPVTSCNLKVREGLNVKTDTETVRKMQRTVFQLLFSAHHMDCKNCGSRKGCQLQKIAKFLGIRLKARKLEELGRDLSVKPQHPHLDINPARCILCHRCLYVCQQKQGSSVLTVERKAFDTAIGCIAHDDPATLPCAECKACVDICPVSAITAKVDAVVEAAKEA